MKNCKCQVLCFIIFLFCTEFVMATVVLPAIVSSNMVLQRNTTITLWGWADPNEELVITTSWIDAPLEVQAGADGKWNVDVQTTLSVKQQFIRIKSDDSNILLDNVLFGEVWLCSGQSNMEQPIKGFNGQPTFGSNMAITTSHNSNLRLFTVKRAGSKKPLEKVDKYAKWQSASPENVGDFSAVGYFFGEQLQEVLDVPVGIIHISWGGSIIEAWMSKEVLSKIQDVNIEDADLEKSNRVQTALFNAMIHPLTSYKIKGVLWYQGESNRINPQEYKTLFPAMVEDWRSRWGIGNIPFYYVQIAPFTYKDFNTELIREAQLKCVDLIPDAGMAVTMDIGEEFSIHPPRKKEVADRLLFLALNQTYNFKSIDHSGPIYDSHEIKNGGIELKFTNAEKGLYARSGLTGFEIAGEDKVFFPAKARIVNRKQVFVKSDEVVNPVAVRYGWKNWIVGSLYDTSMLPASSFRTDDWEVEKRIQE